MEVDLLLAEIGSTTTMVNAFDNIKGEEAVFIGQGMAATSVEDGDVTLGLNKAVEDLKLKIKARDLKWKEFMATSSAAGGLKMTVHGLVKDMTVKVLNKLGSPGVLAHGVAVKPGKPTIFAVLGKQVVFGLPGHPGSSWNVSSIFVKKAVEELLTVDEEKNKLEKNIKKALLSRNIMSEKGREHYFPVKLIEESGKMKALPLLGKSGLISILADADGVIKVKMNTEGLNKGDLVDVELF